MEREQNKGEGNERLTGLFILYGLNFSTIIDQPKLIAMNTALLYMHIRVLQTVHVLFQSQAL